jgi:hydrogenase maturation protease
MGSPSGDDQAGWLTVDALLASSMHVGGEIVIEKLDRPGANLIPAMANASWVILVDAMQSNGAVGQIRRFDQTDWSGFCRGLSSHGFGVLDALSLARELGCLPPRLDLYGIEISQALPGMEPAKGIQDAALQLAGLIANALRQIPST